MRKNHKSSFIRQLLDCCSPSYIFSTLYILCYMNEYSSLTKAQTHQQETTSYSQLRHACTQQACPSLSWILAHFLCHIIFQHHQASSLHENFPLTFNIGKIWRQLESILTRLWVFGTKFSQTIYGFIQSFEHKTSDSLWFSEYWFHCEKRLSPWKNCRWLICTKSFTSVPST